MANWDQFQREFITSNRSIRELARLYGVSENTALSKAAEGEWTRLREEHRSGASRDAQGNDLAAQIRTLNRKDSEGIERVRELALSLLEDQPSANALKTIAQTLEIVQRVSRFAIGVQLVAPTLSPEPTRQLRDQSKSELWEKLLSFPEVMAKIIASGKSPNELDEDEILELVR